MEPLNYPLPMDTPLTEKLCYGIGPKPITLSWSRLSDWVKCNYRVKLIYEGKKTKTTNARNFLAGKVTDLCMRSALDKADKDSEGRLLRFSKDELMAPLEETWNKAINNAEKNTVFKWTDGMTPEADQKRILNSVIDTLGKLTPIIQQKIVGHRFIPEFRPKNMPVIGIPGPSGETCYISLFLAVDCAVQLEEDQGNPEGLGKWGLYDLKTTSTVEYLNKTLPQLVFYDIAFKALTGQNPVDHALWAPLVNPAIRPITVTDEHRRMLMNWIISYCHGVWAGQANFTNDETNCYTCPTKKACPKITNPISKDEQGISRVYFGDNSGGMLHG